MTTHAYVFSYNRPDTLRECLESLFERSVHISDKVLVIDDCSDEETCDVIRDARVDSYFKDHNQGFCDSAQIALAAARHTNPDFVYFIEGDYVFRPGGLDDVHALLTQTEQGKNCMGVVGYDHPNFYYDHFTHPTTGVFTRCMVQQVGEDNVNRAALHKPRFIPQLRLWSELVSNTCWTCYLNWRQIQTVAAEFPELNDLLDQACAPRDNPNYPDSGKYRAQRLVDDGMLSHAMSLVWNRWALKHGVNRDTNAAWLNIKPSVAEHRHQGGLHG
jgi:glycosyltransferase involved in cell wall biosynthesis